MEKLKSYNQLLDPLETLQDNDVGIDQELFKFRAIIGHQGPLKSTDPDWKGSKYNVQVEWETGEVTFEPLSVIAADDLVTCAAYAKQMTYLPWKDGEGSRTLLKEIKFLLGQSSKAKSGKSGDPKPTNTYRNYMEAMQFDKEIRTVNGMMPLS